VASHEDEVVGASHGVAVEALQIVAEQRAGGSAGFTEPGSACPRSSGAGG
jgi:hypothetical protein